MPWKPFAPTPGPACRSNVDTDQIIPAVYLKRVTQTGFEDGLFASWRTDPSFGAQSCAVRQGLVFGRRTRFGAGSSREHAVWALMDYGFQMVIPSGPHIFRQVGKAGLLAAEVAASRCRTALEADRAASARNHMMQDRNIAGNGPAAFTIDHYTAWRLLEGLDDIGLTLRKLARSSHMKRASGLETPHSAGLTIGTERAEIEPLKRSPPRPPPAKWGKRIAEMFATIEIAHHSRKSVVIGLPSPLVGPRWTTGFGGFA